MLEDVVSCYHVKGYFDMWRSKTFRLYFFLYFPPSQHTLTHPPTHTGHSCGFTSSNFPLALRPTGNDRTWQLHPAVWFNQRSVSLFYIDSCSWPIEVNKTTLIQTCDSDLWGGGGILVFTPLRGYYFSIHWPQTGNWKVFLIEKKNKI